MTDVFFSYSSKDRDRVRPFHEALTALDFQVFWDQEVPAGTDWDTWIREQLTKSRAAVVFWSAESVASDNVRHEATVAKQDGKLVPVMLDDLRVDQFPMGLFNTQAARLMDWTGDPDDPEWKKLIGEIQSNAMPAWVGRLLAYKDEELRTERKKRESAQASGDAARNELEKEIGSIDDLRRARDAATSDAERARAEVDGVKIALEESKAKADDLAARLSAAETAAAKQGATAKNRAPAWLLTASSLVSLAAGAAAVYIFQVVPNQQLADNASTKIELAKTEAAATIQRLRGEKKEAEERARARQLEADQARIERNAAEMQITKLKRNMVAGTDKEPVAGEIKASSRAPKNAGKTCLGLAESNCRSRVDICLWQTGLSNGYCDAHFTHGGCMNLSRNDCAKRTGHCIWDSTVGCAPKSMYRNASTQPDDVRLVHEKSKDAPRNCTGLPKNKCKANANYCSWQSGSGYGYCDSHFTDGGCINLAYRDCRHGSNSCGWSDRVGCAPLGVLSKLQN